MAPKKSVPSKTNIVVAKVQEAAQKVAAVAGSIVGRKNQLVKKAKDALDLAKAKVHELTAEKKTTASNVKKDAKKAVRKVKRRAVKKVAGLAAAGVAHKVEKKAEKVKKAVKRAVKK